MIREAYERLMMDVTEFDAEDVITTSGVGPGGGGSGGGETTPNFAPGTYEFPIGF